MGEKTYLQKTPICIYKVQDQKAQHLHTIFVRDLDTKFMISGFGGSKLVILFSAQHKLILFDIKSLKATDFNLTFKWTQNGLIDSFVT